MVVCLSARPCDLSRVKPRLRPKIAGIGSSTSHSPGSHSSSLPSSNTQHFNLQSVVVGCKLWLSLQNPLKMAVKAFAIGQHYFLWAVLTLARVPTVKHQCEVAVEPQSADAWLMVRSGKSVYCKNCDVTDTRFPPATFQISQTPSKYSRKCCLWAL